MLTPRLTAGGSTSRCCGGAFASLLELRDGTAGRHPRPADDAAGQGTDPGKIHGFALAGPADGVIKRLRAAHTSSQRNS